ncbi:hypothetical protein [Lacipirellula parvula]|uniref:Uncharacterized protein n=1 Tax=Lacipirellula parvula TaxID=2650471 RepID=A0A5K7XEC1_9BACT|nr:hypothetical protein [Lacipirellula parvula]BBO34735.1 hypothetical protein PLANPX_4347 [Lacipirellula parvula]
MSAKFTISGDSSSAVKAVGDLNKALDAAEETAQGATKATTKMINEASRIKESLDPQLKYNNAVEKMAALVKSGALSHDEAARKVAQYRKRLDEAGKSGDDAFGAKALSSLKSFAGGVLSATAIVSELRSQLEAVNRENEKAAQAKLGAADAEAALRESTSKDPKRNWIVAQAKQIAQDRKMSEAGIYQMVETAYAAGGDPDLAINSVREATKQSRNIERATATAGGIGDIYNSTNIKDVEEAAGYLAITQATSRIKGEKVAKSIAGTASSYTSQGGSEAAAAAVLSALSVAGADAEGDISRSAAIGLQTKSRDWFAKNGKNFGLTDASQYDIIDERIALLQSNPEMAKQFLGSTKFEAASEGAIAKLLQDKGTIDLYRNAYTANDEASERIAAARDRAKFVGEGPLQNYAMTEQAIQNEMDQMRISGDAALSEERRNDVFELSRRLEGNGRGHASWLKFMAETGPTLSNDEAIDQLKKGMAMQDWRTGGMDAMRESGSPAAMGEVARRETAERLLAELEKQTQALQAIQTKQNSRVSAQQE